jgi:hypothetical protein
MGIILGYILSGNAVASFFCEKTEFEASTITGAVSSVVALKGKQNKKS